MEVEQCTITCTGKTVNIYLLNMDSSYFVWIGDEPNIKEIAVSMKARLDSDTVSTQLLGPRSSLTSLNLSQKLAHKFKSQFYVSCSFSDPLMLAHLETWLFKHFQQQTQS
jgi:hypothetical protein